MFLLGNWKNYQELEENLSVPELMATLEAYREKLKSDRIFMAALQGVDLDKSSGEKTGEDVIRRARIKAAGGDPDTGDIVNISGELAKQEGFGIGMGLGYEQV